MRRASHVILLRGLEGLENQLLNKVILLGPIPRSPTVWPWVGRKERIAFEEKLKAFFGRASEGKESSPFDTDEEDEMLFNSRSSLFVPPLPRVDLEFSKDTAVILPSDLRSRVCRQYAGVLKRVASQHGVSIEEVPGDLDDFETLYPAIVAEAVAKLTSSLET